jgi:UDP-glucose 4-epimerase
VISYRGSSETLREYIHVQDAARASVVVLDDEFCNASIVLTGQEPMRVRDMLEMLREILGYSEAVQFIEGEQSGHYIRTPYAYEPRIGRKYVPPLHMDLGQGLVQLIDLVHRAQSKHG